MSILATAARTFRSAPLPWRLPVDRPPQSPAGGWQRRRAPARPCDRAACVDAVDRQLEAAADLDSMKREWTAVRTDRANLDWLLLGNHGWCKRGYAQDSPAGQVLESDHFCPLVVEKISVLGISLSGGCRLVHIADRKKCTSTVPARGRRWRSRVRHSGRAMLSFLH